MKLIYFIVEISRLIDPPRGKRDFHSLPDLKYYIVDVKEETAGQKGKTKHK